MGRKFPCTWTRKFLGNAPLFSWGVGGARIRSRWPPVAANSRPGTTRRGTTSWRPRGRRPHGKAEEARQKAEEPTPRGRAFRRPVPGPLWSRFWGRRRSETHGMGRWTHRDANVLSRPPSFVGWPTCQRERVGVSCLVTRSPSGRNKGPCVRPTVALALCSSPCTPGCCGHVVVSVPVTPQSSLLGLVLPPGPS